MDTVIKTKDKSEKTLLYLNGRIDTPISGLGTYPDYSLFVNANIFY